MLTLLSVSSRVFGLEHWLAQQGIAGQFNGLVLMSLLFGFGGSFISLAISKWMARRSMGVHSINQPANDKERWLFNTVAAQAKAANIGMPEVGYSSLFSRMPLLLV